MNWSWLSARMVRWTLFSVAASVILPVGFNWIVGKGAKVPHGFTELLGSGDFLLTCVALNTAGIGELLGRSTASKKTRAELVVAAISGGIAVFASVFYASIRSGGEWSKTTVAILSLSFLLGTLFSTGACIQLSAPEEAT
jgi:uncharacterized membrane protein YjjP (DUF1212 family)